ncbi:putative omega-hydroxypalmitate O-feruloyl transferase [Medicago truncatula]|uniref:Putative omega-hydroxypalmitate O-feruloyl transferase n=1 Tax=Medicago truncatula TaxID=3880 RepID=A0A396JN11_MEDTR|nr:putative omega-hydroxypalmitate O-feruloyl transferase [Medicago truncatula]
MSFLSKPPVTTSFTFGVNEINCLKKQCTTSSFNKITTFEVVIAHTWHSFVKSGDLPLSQSLKLCFTFSFRKKMKLPERYYGNGFVLVCAESTMKDLYVRLTIDVLKDKTVITDCSLALIISQVRQLGLEDVDFGEGKPFHLSPYAGKLFCIFLPVIGDPKAVRVCISLPKTMEGKFQRYMREIENWDKYEYKMPIWARM